MNLESQVLSVLEQHVSMLALIADGIPMSASRDLFETVVGVPVADWVAADTPAKFAALLYKRDNPVRCSVQHVASAEVRTFGGTVVRTVYPEACNGYHDDGLGVGRG